MAATLHDKRVLIVGAGGLGCPTGRVLARSGVGQIDVADHDRIEASNLPRQTLYDNADIGQSKVAVFCRALREEGSCAGYDIRTVAREMRVVASNAAELVSSYDSVVDGSDNYATKFLIADACALARVPVVHAGAIRWGGWALGASPGGPCLRCVFEDMPRDRADTCASAGVVGPAVGVVAAVQASIVLRFLLGDTSAAGVLWRYDGLAGALRATRTERQTRCLLCDGRITNLEVSRYTPPAGAAQYALSQRMAR